MHTLHDIQHPQLYLDQCLSLIWIYTLTKTLEDYAQDFHVFMHKFGYLNQCLNS